MLVAVAVDVDLDSQGLCIDISQNLKLHSWPWIIRPYTCSSVSCYFLFRCGVFFHLQ